MAARTRSRGVVPARPARSRVVAGGVAASSHVAEIQRARLLAGALWAVDEFGYTRTTVTEITAKARVSRRTFYELFANGEDCLAAMLDEMVGRVRCQLSDPELGELAWCERVREGLWRILSFLDREPVLARVCVVQSARGGQRILERREQLLKELASILDEGRAEGDPKTDCPALTAEGLVGAAVSIVHSRVLRGESVLLTDLHGELMAMIVLPYLGPVAARQERKRKAPSSGAAGRADTGGGLGVSSTESGANDAHGDPLQGVPIRLTYRTVCVLEVIAEHPGLSNRSVGEQAGIADQGQISKLLARLERYGLLENKGQGAHTKGEANAWTLTSTGVQVAQSILAHTPISGTRSPQEDRHDTQH
jgi:AcrR family transcriptional regulator